MNPKYTIITGPESIQGSPEWLQFRKGKMTASMAPSVMDIGFQSRLEIWESIVFDKPVVKNEAMERGIILEPIARDWINRKWGYNYQPVVIQSVEHPEWIASLDGYFEDDDGVHILEIKCAGPVDHAVAISGHIPDKYKPQLQHQMDIAGVHSMIYLSFDGKEGVTVRVQREERYCRELFAQEKEFMQSLIDLIPPKATDRDWIQQDEHETLDVLLYNSLSEAVDALISKREEVRKRILSFVEHPRTKIGKTRIQRITKKGEVDYSRLVEDFGISHEAERYRKPASQYWKITY